MLLLLLIIFLIMGLFWMGSTKRAINRLANRDRIVYLEGKEYADNLLWVLVGLAIIFVLAMIKSMTGWW
jgi:hypothetical protein